MTRMIAIKDSVGSPQIPAMNQPPTQAAQQFAEVSLELDVGTQHQNRIKVQNLIMHEFILLTTSRHISMILPSSCR